MRPLALRTAFTVPARVFHGLALACGLLWLPATASAQRIVRDPEQVVSVSKGASVLMVNQAPIQRFSVGDPNVAQAVVVSPTEILVNGKTLGTTSLVLWDAGGTPKLYSVEVTADAPGLERYLQALMPAESIAVSASGNSVTLSGNVKDPNSVGRAIEVARSTGAVIVDNMVAPSAVQVLLQVRFAEISRTRLQGVRRGVQRPQHRRAARRSQLGREYGIRGADPGTGVLCPAPTSRRSSAPPRAGAVPQPGRAESPHRSRQGSVLPGRRRVPVPDHPVGQRNGGITIVFKDFGIKLRFTPTITRSGAIRLKLAPEVSSLDFANGLVISGFEIPTHPDPAGRDRGRAPGRAAPGHRGADGQQHRQQRHQDSRSWATFRSWGSSSGPPTHSSAGPSSWFWCRPRLVQATETATPLPTDEPKAWEWDGSIGAPKTGPPAAAVDDAWKRASAGGRMLQRAVGRRRGAEP